MLGPEHPASSRHDEKTTAPAPKALSIARPRSARLQKSPIVSPFIRVASAVSVISLMLRLSLRTLPSPITNTHTPGCGPPKHRLATALSPLGGCSTHWLAVAFCCKPATRRFELF